MKWRMRMALNTPISTQKPDRAAAAASPVVPSAVLRASFTAAEGITVLNGKYHNAPLKIAKTFPLDKQLGVIMMDVSPGLLDGDSYELDWEAGKGAHVFITNQSYTKVHPCSEGSMATMVQRFRLDDGACVENMMEPVMLYRDAAFRNDTEVTLGKGSAWMQMEVICPGRTLRGEKFLYRQLDNRIRVYYGEEPVFAQRQLIEPLIHQLNAPGAWGDWSHLGTFYCFSDGIDPSHAAAIREALAAIPERAGQTVLSGVSLTRKHGLAVITAGYSAWQLEETLRAAWNVMRRELLGLPPLKFRK